MAQPRLAWLVVTVLLGLTIFKVECIQPPVEAYVAFSTYPGYPLDAYPLKSSAYPYQLARVSQLHILQNFGLHFPTPLLYLLLLQSALKIMGTDWWRHGGSITRE